MQPLERHSYDKDLDHTGSSQASSTDQPLQGRRSYQYRPLDRSRNEVRLLDIPTSSNADADDLVATIRHVSLLDHPNYETASYVWGDPTPTHHILLNNSSLRVPANTWRAIQRFRDSYKIRTLWIDAVCINQADTDEKSWQVSLMGAIYEQSSLGLIYLGEKLSTTRQTFSSLLALAEHFHHVKSGLFRPLSELAVVIGSSEGEISKEGLYDFLHIPWFRRVWVTQEAVLAPKSTCFYGLDRIDLDLLMSILLYLERVSLEIRVVISAHPGLIAMTDLHQARWLLHNNRRRAPMSTVLRFRRDLRATDDRDRIYSILGITHDTDDLPALLTVDYNKSYAEVMRDAVRNCIIEENSLYVLQDVDQLLGSVVGANDFPSWVPRFERTKYLPEFLPQVKFKIAVPEPAYEVDTCSPHKDDVPGISEPEGTETLGLPGATLDHDILRITGMFVDRIKQTELFPDARFQKLEVTLSRIIDFGISLDISRTERLFRIPIANCTEQHKPFPWQDRDFLGDLLEYLQDGRQIPRRSVSDSHPDDDMQALFEYHRSISNFAPGRAIIAGDAGHLALGPETSQPGDMIVATMQPDTWLFIVRPLEDGTWHLLGPCYVDELRTPALLENFLNPSEEELFYIR